MVYSNTSCEQVSRRQAVTNIIDSIAKEELAIAALLDAEAGKVEAAVKNFKPCIKDLESINHSVCSCLKNLIKLQMLLEFKLEEVKDLIDDSDY